jgi:hypothetical protein
MYPRISDKWQTVVIDLAEAIANTSAVLSGT